MTIALTSLSILCVALIFAVFRLARTIFTLEDKVEFALDQIDESVQVIDEILNRPLFYDSPEVREVHRQISLVNISLVNIASVIAESENKDEE
tara:strand:+ start:795 stop:1073 length:279 start_codon:yes stop_codon:yes gene_type:complete